MEYQMEKNYEDYDFLGDAEEYAEHHEIDPWDDDWVFAMKMEEKDVE